MRNISDSYSVIHLLDSQSITSDTDASSVDVGADYNEDVLAIVNLGAVSGSSPTLDIKIQGSDNDSDWSDIDSFNQLTDSDSNGTVALGLKNTYRYLRASLTTGGSSPDFQTAIVAAVERTNGNKDLNQ